MVPVAGYQLFPISALASLGAIQHAYGTECADADDNTPQAESY